MAKSTTRRKGGTLRIGILGAGLMARTHTQRLLKVGGVSVDAVCGISLDEAQAFSKQNTEGAAVPYADFGAMISERKLNAVYVALPPFAHNGQVEAAARAGLHLFMEKPLALSVERARSMVRAIEKAGVISQIGYHMRFGSAVRRLKQMIEDGSAGEPTLFEGIYLCNALHGPWWRDVSRSGGQVLEQAIHLYDMAMYLLGEPRTVCGMADNLGHTKVPGYTVEDTSASVIRFASGAIASISASNCAVPTQWRGPFRVVCEKVTVEFADPNEAVFTATGRTSEDCWRTGKMPQPEPVNEQVDMYLAETERFLATVRGQAQPIAPARQGLLGVQLVTSMLESARSKGQPVSIRTTR
jgi:predicted dehydrogenase